MNKVFFEQPIIDTTSIDQRPGYMPVKERMEVPHTRPPGWIKVKLNDNENYRRVRSILKEHQLHSVCAEASCPNIHECYGEGTATFMILGKYCTRNCSFCDVLTGKPKGLDTGEPERLAEVVALLKLKQVVITSVTRDDLPDGGASTFARTVELLRRRDNDVRIELLIPDLGGNTESLDIVLNSRPDVFAHNVETVFRLHRRVRSAAKLDRSLAVLRYGSQFDPRPVVKPGIMVGVGETTDELVELMHQVHGVGTDILTIGQYLRPSLAHLPVEKFYTPDEFDELASIGRGIGFAHVEAGPLVRSSYKAFNQSRTLLGKSC